ncbi:hypothetical protein NR800_09155 [Corallococcus interemptor]|uniref:hypothetical protein n=1 Tax=Corallococcus TaxID=83461 RepID=UPI0035D51A69
MSENILKKLASKLGQNEQKPVAAEVDERLNEVLDDYLDTIAAAGAHTSWHGDHHSSQIN